MLGYVGDSVRIRSIFYDRGDRIALTGEVGEIVSIDTHLVKIKITTTNPRVISIPTNLVEGFVSLGYVSTIDSAQGMTCKKAGVVLRGGEDGHAVYSGGTRGTKFPKVLIFYDKSGLGDGAQYLQTEIVPEQLLDRVLSRSNRSPDFGNLVFYKEEFQRIHDQDGVDLVEYILNKAVIHEAEKIIGQPEEPTAPATPPSPPVVLEEIQPSLDFEFGSAAPLPVIPPPRKPQTVQELCEELLTYDVVDIEKIGNELIKHSKEFGQHLITLDSASQQIILNKLPDVVVREIERRWNRQRQRQQERQQEQQNEREIEF